MVARGTVRYVGEIVAAVAATDPATAAKAVAAIEIDYEPLPRGAVDRRGARARRTDPAPGLRRVLQGHPGRRPRQRGVREQRAGRRCRARLPRVRRGGRGHLGDPGAAPRLPGAERLRGRRRREPGASRCTRPASPCTTSSSASPTSSASRWRRSASWRRGWAAVSAASMPRTSIRSRPGSRAPRAAR